VSLWFKVLVSRYGEEDGCVKEGRRTRSSWWKEIMGIRSGDGIGVGSWFDENLVQVVGDGAKRSFG